MVWLTVLGLPAAVYVASMTALMFCLSEKPQNLLVLLGAGSLTAGIYMFHRTSIAAVEPMQARHRIAIRHRRLLRRIAWCLLALSAAMFALHHPVSTVLVFGSLAGVIVYGRKTITKPVRNVTVLKPFAVGVAISVFAWALNDFSNATWTLVAFMLICSADALVCDLVDCTYDAASGCSTLATKFGVRGTWFVAGLLYVLAAVCFQSPVGWIFLLLFLFPSLVQKTIRTAVDVRPILVLLLAWSV